MNTDDLRLQFEKEQPDTDMIKKIQNYEDDDEFFSDDYVLWLESRVLNRPKERKIPNVPKEDRVQLNEGAISEIKEINALKFSRFTFLIKNIYFFLLGIKMKNIGVYESDDSHWELIRVWDDDFETPLDKFRLIFFPEEICNNDETTEIVINKTQLKDLITFTRKIR